MTCSVRARKWAAAARFKNATATPTGCSRALIFFFFLLPFLQLFWFFFSLHLRLLALCPAVRYLCYENWFWPCIWRNPLLRVNYLTLNWADLLLCNFFFFFSLKTAVLCVTYFVAIWRVIHGIFYTLHQPTFYGYLEFFHFRNYHYTINGWNIGWT